jgi:hypothetical protein
LDNAKEKKEIFVCLLEGYLFCVLEGHSEEDLPLVEKEEKKKTSSDEEEKISSKGISGGYGHAGAGLQGRGRPVQAVGGHGCRGAAGLGAP